MSKGIPRGTAMRKQARTSNNNIQIGLLGKKNASVYARVCQLPGGGRGGK